MREAKNEQHLVQGKVFSFLKHRLNGGKVFVNRDGSEYLRTATSPEIADEVALTRGLYRRGFPVPEVLATGELEDGMAYYIEKSIGERVFGEIFREETSQQGRVGDDSFDAFVRIVVRYCEAQFDPKNAVPRGRDALTRLTEFANVMRNNPPSPEIRQAFLEAHEQASTRVMSLPWGHVQYDFNPFNVLRGGIIDFEFAGSGPVGYDTFTCAHFGRMWPKRRIAYVLTDNQIARYVGDVDKIGIAKGLPAISSFANEFLVLKAIWSTAKEKASEDNPGSNPDFWEWRVRMRDWCIGQYVRGEKIDSNRFEAVATA